MPLSQAMAPDMLAEIYRRKKSAVMVVFETKKASSLIYIHNQLQKIAEGRTPQRATDL
jgi:hypothetical protein